MRADDLVDETRIRSERDVIRTPGAPALEKAGAFLLRQDGDPAHLAGRVVGEA